jgi:hypothetical protein
MSLTKESGIFDLGTFDNAKFDNVTISEDVTLLDNELLNIVRDLIESFSFSDGGTKLFYRILLESYGISDNYSRTWSLNRMYPESYSLLDDIVQISLVYLKTLLESFNLSETKIFKIVKLLSEDFNLNDNYSRIWTLSRIISEAFNLSSEILKQTERELIETSTLSDKKIILVMRTLLDTTNLSDNLLRSINKLLSENIILSDAFISEFLKFLTLLESTALLDTLQESWTARRTYSESLSILDIKSLSIIRILSDSFTLGEDIFKLTNKILIESFLLSDIIYGDKGLKLLLKSIEIKPTVLKSINVKPTALKSIDVKPTFLSSLTN